MKKKHSFHFKILTLASLFISVTMPLFSGYELAHADVSGPSMVSDATSTNTSNQQAVDTAVSSAKSISANINQDATKTYEANASNYQSVKAQADADNAQVVKNINDSVQAYKDKVAAYQKTLSGNQISTNDIIQNLQLNDEPDANMSWTSSGNIAVTQNGAPSSHVGYTPTNISAEPKSGNTITGSVTITYTNLKNSYYLNDKISKIIITYSNVQADSSDKATIYAFSNPSNGFWYNNATSADANYQYYDSHNNLITFANQSDGSGAWITAGSLNSGWGRTEGVNLNSSGKVYGLQNSSVIPHGNHLYADTVNEGDGWPPSGTNADDITGSGSRDNHFIQQLTQNWDTGLSNSYAYIGAGEMNVLGSNVSLTWTTQRHHVSANSDTWATMSTNIVSDNSGITKPNISYHYVKINVNLNVTANYLQNTDASKNEDGSKLADSVTTSGHPGDSYNTENKTFTGWHLISVPSNANGTIPNDNVTVNYIYDRNPASVKVRYVDRESGAELSASDTVNGYYGLPYKTSAKTITGYNLDGTPSNATGTLYASNADVIYYYSRKSETVKANYIADTNASKSEYGQTLAPSETYSGLYGKPYSTIQKAIVGWSLLFPPTNASGVYGDPTTADVNYIYSRNAAKVLVNYVDTKGNQLLPTKVLNGYYGLNYTTSPESISKYHLTSMPSNSSGMYSDTPITVTYVYDTNPAIQEGINSNSVSASNYSSALNTTSQSISYNKTYHYESKVTVGGSMTLNDLNVQTTLGKDVNPILKSGNINSQDIHVYAVNSDGSFTDVTSQGDLQYTVNGTSVSSSANTNTLIDMDKSRVVSWKAHTPANFVGKTLVTDIPIQLKPDSSKLSGYKTSSGIKVANSTSLIENNDISDNSPVRTSTTSVKTLNSNNVTFNLGDIYTIKASKSIFNSNKAIGGKIYLTLSNNLVASSTTTTDNNAVTVSAAGQNKNIDLSLSNNKQIITVPIDSSQAASQSSPTFGVTVTSNNKNNNTDNIVLSSSLVKSESSSNSVTTTVYNDDIYDSSTKAAQYPKANTTGTSAVAPEAVETYYYQNTGDANSQYEVTNEMQPLYVKLMESMYAQYNSTVSAKAGYGIKNDVVLNYYGRHLNSANESVADFENNNLATTFSTNTDLTTVKGVSSSQIKNNTSELLDYTATDTPTNDMITALNGMSASDKSKYLTKVFDANTANKFLYNQNGAMTLDNASTDISKSTSYSNLDSTSKSLVDAVDKVTNTTPTTPRLYTMSYRFNKRLLMSSGNTKQGIEYYDTTSSHVKNNSSILSNNASASNAQDGGYEFYTNQWLALGNYATTYKSTTFGSNDFVFQLNRNLDIYGHRYLSKGNGTSGDTYDDISIQPVISSDLNNSNTTIAANAKWEDK